MRRHTAFVLGMALFVCAGIPSARGEDEEKKQTCLALVTERPDPKPIERAALVAAIRELKTVDGKQLVAFSEEFGNRAAEMFDPARVRTKMEQFFRFLHLLAGNVEKPLPGIVEVDPVAVRKILIVGGVFPDSELPDQIRGVTMDRTRKEDPRYTVRFASDVTKLPLNRGNGFYAYTHGLCQHTTALLFYRKFAFSLRILRNGNILARYFQGADLFGTFGNRGLFDVDFQYVALLSVEFFKGEKKGEVTAALSQEEFKKNEHNALLRLVSRFVKNSSVQPVGW